MDRKRFFVLPWLALAAAATIARADKAPAGAEAAAAPPQAVGPWKLTDMQAWMEAFTERLDAIPSYQATVVSRERVDGTLKDYRYLYLKSRREPKSFYMYFLGPEDIKGHEALYAKDKNDGRMLISRSPGLTNVQRGNSFPLNSFIVTHGMLCPLHRLNLRDLTEEFIKIIRDNTARGTSQVQKYVRAKINGRLCTCWELDHRGDKERFVMRIFADDALNVPCRFEIHTAKAKKDTPELLREYTFLGPDGGKKPIAIDANLTDADFDRNNPSYGFPKTSTDANKGQQKEQPQSKPSPRQTTNEKQQAEQKREPEPSSNNCGCRRRGRWRR